MTLERPSGYGTNSGKKNTRNFGPTSVFLKGKINESMGGIQTEGYPS